QIHNPEAGRKASNDGLVSAVMLQITANASQGFRPSLSFITSDNQNSTAISRAARLVSHTQRVDQYIIEGRSAQVHALHTATRSLKHRFAVKKMGMQVSAEKMQLMVNKINADAWL